MRGNPTKTRSFLPMPCAMVALLLAGCGGGAGMQPAAGMDPGAAVAPAGDQVAVRVQNNTISPTSVTVYAVPETGVRQMLGLLNPSETKTFTFDPTAATSQYRLVAEATGGAELVSREFSFAGTTGVVWDMSLNSVTPIS